MARGNKRRNIGCFSTQKPRTGVVEPRPSSKEAGVGSMSFTRERLFSLTILLIDYLSRRGSQGNNTPMVDKSSIDRFEEMCTSVFATY